MHKIMNHQFNPIKTDDKIYAFKYNMKTIKKLIRVKKNWKYKT